MLTQETLPTLVREVVGALRERLGEWERRITDYDHRLAQLAKQNEAARRLMQGEGVGPMTATALVATVGEGHAFHHGRQFAAWLGLVPKQHSTGGKTVLGRITKQGNVYLRTLLIHGARAVLQSSATTSYTSHAMSTRHVYTKSMHQRSTLGFSIWKSAWETWKTLTPLKHSLRVAPMETGIAGTSTQSSSSF